MRATVRLTGARHEECAPVNRRFRGQLALVLRRRNTVAHKRLTALMSQGCRHCLATCSIADMPPTLSAFSL